MDFHQIHHLFHETKLYFGNRRQESCLRTTRNYSLAGLAVTGSRTQIVDFAVQSNSHQTPKVQTQNSEETLDYGGTFKRSNHYHTPSETFKIQLGNNCGDSMVVSDYVTVGASP